MATKKPKPLYSLTTAEVLPTISIDGKEYPFRLNVEYAEILQLQDIGDRIRDITEKGNARTEQDEAELPELLKRATIRMVDLPPEVDARLNDLDRFRITAIFNDLVQERLGNPPDAGNGSGSPD